VDVLLPKSADQRAPILQGFERAFLLRKSIGSQSIARLARFFLDAKHVAGFNGVSIAFGHFSETD
jgi:hypothetical protein